MSALFKYLKSRPCEGHGCALLGGSWSTNSMNYKQSFNCLYILLPGEKKIHSFILFLKEISKILKT